MTAFLVALVIGNYLFYYGNTTDPIFHLDIYTFVSVLSFGVVGVVIALIIRRRK